MTSRITRVILVISMVFGAVGVLNAQKDFPVLNGPYLGQKPPGTVPQIFSPQLPATLIIDSYYNFSEKGNVLLFKGSLDSCDGIFLWERKTDLWLPPQFVMSLSEHEDRHFFLSPDGGKIYFTSKRPFRKGESEAVGPHLWVTVRGTTGWTEPIPFGYTSNPRIVEYYSTVSGNGNVYFTRSSLDETMCDIFLSRFVNGKFSDAVDLDKVINSDTWDGDPYIAPDESYMIFCSYRSGGLGEHDFYISYRSENDSWTTPKNLGKVINSRGNDVCPLVSSDGKYFFFISKRTGNYTDYWVDTWFIDQLKPKQ